MKSLSQHATVVLSPFTLQTLKLGMFDNRCSKPRRRSKIICTDQAHNNYTG